MSRVAPFAVGLALGLGIALAVSAIREPDAPPARSGAPIQDVLEYHADALGLDRATNDEAWALANAARDELDGYRATIRAEREQLNQILDAAEVDRARMEAVVGKISAAERELRIREIEVMLEIRALLTPEQIDVLEKLGPPPPPARER
ncbi:periplasmic protein [Enhygromyxa salina]|uniref:Periplasmic protein n=1 Tax=Enhygromyxa salina TaxID=215803 RepID=A0A2S9XDM2_9BACT|nr:periplasmic heavy metal sensor [Enhygromyxa salina]PRP90968.1 periplasmic protein [Enhygromyxa salina]